MTTAGFTRFLERNVDPVLASVIHFGQRLELRDPVRWALAGHRQAAMQRTASAYAARVEALAAAVAERDPSAITRYDALIAEAMDAMRAERPSGGVATAVYDAIDRRFYRNDPELLDDPSFPQAERARGLAGLHKLNEVIGSYEAFLGAIEPLLHLAEMRAGRPVRIHDLAAGHGGFAVLLKQRQGDRVATEASDIKDEYLELGRARAAELGVDVDFFVEDALAIDGPRARGVDIVTCTQSIHHFPPGMVARMMGEAARAARVGVCFIDGERSVLMCGLIAAVSAVYGRSYVLVHDGIVSLRRMFYAEELALLVALAPRIPATCVVETGAMLPGHAFVRITAASTPAGE